MLSLLSAPFTEFFKLDFFSNEFLVFTVGDDTAGGDKDGRWHSHAAHARRFSLLLFN